MTISIEEIRRKASGAIVALANRASIRREMRPEKLREAIEYYEIAASIAPEPDRAFAIYQKAILLEEAGDFAEAEKTYLEVAGSEYYSEPGKLGASRCKEKQKGNYDPGSELKNFFTQSGVDVPMVGAMQNIFKDLLGSITSEGDQEPDASTEESGSDEVDEQMSAVALAFVNHLLDRDYASAKAMLHSSMASTTAEELKRSFEGLFRDEEFPESANVYSVDMDFPDKPDGDLAFVYVSIDSENGEAVSVVVALENSRFTIREIEWGRP